MAVVNTSDSDSGTGADIIMGRGLADVGTGVETWIYPVNIIPHAADSGRSTETEYIRKTRSGVWLAPYIGPGETESFQPEGTAGTYPGTITPPDERI